MTLRIEIRMPQATVYYLMILLLISSIPIIFTSSASAQDHQFNSSEIRASSTGPSSQAFGSSGDNKYVAWADNSPGNYDIMFRRSTDNGATWQPSIFLSKNLGDSWPPLMAVSGSNVYVIWEQWNAAETSSDIMIRQSTDNGDTWKSILNLSNDAELSFEPRIAVSGSKVYIVWTEFGGGESDVLFRRSTDNGSTWKPTVSIGANTMNGVDQTDIKASGSNVFVTWSGYIDDPSILLRRSTDSGATWKPIVDISATENEDPQHPQLALSGTNVYVVWSEQNDNYDVTFRRSTDSGATWKSVKTLKFNSGDSDRPQIAASGSDIHVVWEDKSPAPGIFDIFYMRSTDNGATWKLSVNLSKNPGHSHYPDLIVSGADVFVAWFDSSFHPQDILFRQSADGGATWKPIKNLSETEGESQVPQIAISGSNLYVLWEEYNPDFQADIAFKRSTDAGATWKNALNLSDNAGDSRLLFARS